MSLTYDISNSTISYHNNIYIFDYEIIDKILNFNLQYKFYNDNHCKSLIELIFDNYSNKIQNNFTYIFINGNNYDFRKSNIKLITFYPVYNTKECTIKYRDVLFKFDKEQFSYIINNKKTLFFEEYDKYPICKNNNNSKINFLEYLFKFKENNIYYSFKNGDCFDLRNENISIFHNKHKYILENYSNCVYYPGHYKITGNDAYVMKNPYWKIIEKNSENSENSKNNDYYLMYCEPDTYIKLDEDSLNSITEYETQNNNREKLTFFKMKNGYISCKLSNSASMLYIHQIIMNLYGQGKGTNTISVDHINRDPLDNRSSNLTIATLNEQQNNSKGVINGTKRERKINAQELPEGINQEDMPKYVYYCKEKYNSNGDLREFFRIEKHPNQKSIISSSKSNKIGLIQKLNEVKEILKKLDNNTYYNDDNLFKLPVGFYITKFRNCDNMVYDYRNIETNERKNMKMKLPENYDIKIEYDKFVEKLNKKYSV